MKVWKDNLGLDVSGLFEMVMDNISHSCEGMIDDFVEMCIEELKTTSTLFRNCPSTLVSNSVVDLMPLKAAELASPLPNSAVDLPLSKASLIDMFLKMDKLSRLSHKTCIYSLHMNLEFYESLGQTILQDLELDSRCSKPSLEAVESMKVFKLHIEWICNRKSASLETSMQSMGLTTPLITSSFLETKINDFLDIWMIVFQDCIEKLVVKNSSSELISTCLDITAKLVSQELITVDSICIERLKVSLRSHLTRDFDSWLVFTIYKLLKTIPNTSLHLNSSEWLGKVTSMLLKSTESYKIKSVLECVDVDILASFNENLALPQAGNTVIEMVREFDSVLKEMKHRHAKELEAIEQASISEPAIDPDMMNKVQKVCGENSTLKERCKGFEDQVKVLEESLYNLQGEFDICKTNNVALTDSLSKVEAEKLDFSKKIKNLQQDLQQKQAQIAELQGMIDEDKEYQQVLAKLAEKVSARKRAGRDKTILQERTDIANLSAVMFE